MSDPAILAAGLTLLVALNFGFASHFQHKALDHMDVRSGTLVNIATSAILLWLAAPFYLVPETLLTPPIALFALSGLIVPAMSITFTTQSVKMIGPALTSGLASTSPIFAMMIAVIFLGELITVPIIAGTLIVISGVMVIALRSARADITWPIWAVALPLLAALTRGISHPLTKAGLTDLPSPLTAALVASTVSLIVLATLYLFSGQKPPRWNRGYSWFALCGVINGAGIVGLNTALDIGSVVIVSPLIATTPAFTLLLGYFIFRRETIAWSSLLAIGLIFTGCFLIITR